jgi:hypothetical protein
VAKTPYSGAGADRLFPAAPRPQGARTRCRQGCGTNPIEIDRQNEEEEWEFTCCKTSANNRSDPLWSPTPPTVPAHPVCCVDCARDVAISHRLRPFLRCPDDHENALRRSPLQLITQSFLSCWLCDVRPSAWALCPISRLTVTGPCAASFPAAIAPFISPPFYRDPSRP